MVTAVVSGTYVEGDPGSCVALAIVGRGRLDIPVVYNLMGTFKTENMGLERIVANIVLRPSIRHLVVCGREEFGHFPGGALVSLVREGVDDEGRIRGCRSPLPYICNLPPGVLERFRQQITVTDLIHPKDVDEIIEYDPTYDFEDERVSELLDTIGSLRYEGPMGPPPDIDTAGALSMDGAEIGSWMNRMADDIVSGMLAMPSERLVTSVPFIVLSEEHRIVLDPVAGNCMQVPSVGMFCRLRGYLRGEA